MIDTNGAALAVAPDAPSEQPAGLVFDLTRPRVIQPVSIKLDKERHLSLPFWAMLAFERETSLNALDDKMWAGAMSLSTISTLLWAALLEEDPKLKLDQVQRLPGVALPNVPYIRACLERCWLETMPEPEKASNGAVPNERRRIGSS